MSLNRYAWNAIEKKYKELPGKFEGKESMLGLIEHVSDSKIGCSLYPWMSMLDLMITQTKLNPVVETVPYLKISPLKTGCAEFRYVDTHETSKQWVRVASKGRFGERFDSFIEQVGWKINM